jgi:hypothetical protein
MSAQRALATAHDQPGDPVQTATVEETRTNFVAASGDEIVELAAQQGEEPIQPVQPAAGASTLTLTLSPGESEQMVARIKQSAALPPALRERLAALVESSGELTAGGQSRVLLEACLRVLEESLPDFLRESRGDAAPSSHPNGEAFFRGNSAELSDQQAEKLAQQQLVRSGLLRGQRVRVAD